MAFAATSTGRYAIRPFIAAVSSLFGRETLVTWPRRTMVTLVRLCFMRAVSKMLSCCRHSGVSSTVSLLKAQRAMSLFALSLLHSIYISRWSLSLIHI